MFPNGVLLFGAAFLFFVIAYHDRILSFPFGWFPFRFLRKAQPQKPTSLWFHLSFFQSDFLTEFQVVIRVIRVTLLAAQATRLPSLPFPLFRFFCLLLSLKPYL